MRPKFWQYDSVKIDLEDRDVTVRLVHERSLAVVTVEFRIAEAALGTSAGELRRRAEYLARDRLLDLASFLDRP